MSEAWPYRGPRGGRYRVNSKGRKVYDRPKTSERKFTDDGLSAKSLAAIARSSGEEETDLGSAFLFFHGFIWFIAIIAGWGWGHGLLLPLNAVWWFLSQF